MSSRIFSNFIVALLLLATTLPAVIVEAFNVETKHYAIYRNEDESMFGFSVSAYRDKYGRGWAIVGAPEAQTNQPKVYRGGAVYRCDIADDNRCNIIHFDDKGNNYKNPTVSENILPQLDNKTLQWFGATVSASSVDGGPILACAPRYIWFSLSHQKYEPEDSKWNKETTYGNRRDPVGTCWAVLNNFHDSTEFSPCRTRFWGYHRQGSCQAGLGAAMAKNGERVFIGAPGSWYWQGQAFSQPLNNRNNKVMFTKEAPASEDDSYMGYSVATGDFVGNGDSGTAVGVPRGFGLRGKVVLFTSNMTNHQNVSGEQMGAYFGYSIATGDIDGDGLDDLIIGAPMYTIPDNPEMYIETGRIYVIYQGGGPKKFRKIDTRDGESNRGRFGLSLASLGDIDHDGYGDFVVGAPYAGPNNRGAVYIYYGSVNGVHEKYSQVIHAEELTLPVKTFGFSVAGGLDLDGNRYTDVVVGAYESNTAFFFRARPVIKMSSYVFFETDSTLISLDNKNCSLSDGTRVTCLPLKGCFRYTGDNVHLQYNFNVQYVVDVKKTKTPRMFFLKDETKSKINETITLEKDYQYCRTVQAYVTSNIRDKLTSLDAELRISIIEPPATEVHRRDPRIALTPVISSTTSRNNSLSIRKNCGLDDVCIPDLQLIVRPSVERYFLGSEKKLELEILVLNNGEDAFEATYTVKLPPGIDYIKIERLDKTEIPVQCSAPKQSNNNTLRCDIGNPLPQRQSVHFNVLLQPVTSDSMTPSYEFYMVVNTTNAENSSTTGDNTGYLSVPIWIETELLLEGNSRPTEIYYNPDNYTTTNVTTEAEFGKAVIHEYRILNQGPSDVLEVEAFLIWPAQTLGGEELLYLIDQPETTGPIVCETANANYLGIRLEQRRRDYQIDQSFSEPLGVTVHDSNTGKTVNVQRGLEILQANKTYKEDMDANSGDSSDVQKTRHSSSFATNVVSNQTDRIQFTSSSQQPDVKTTSYTLNTTTFTSSGEAGIPAVNREIFLTSSNSFDGGSSIGTGGLHTGVQETRFGSDLSNIDASRGGERTVEKLDTYVGFANVSEHVHESEIATVNEELLRQQKELERRRQDEAARLSLERRREEERRRELERRREEERRRYEEQRRRQEQEENYDYEKRHPTGTITAEWDTTLTGSQSEFQLRNVSSTEELEKVFGSFSKGSTDYRVYNKQGRQYVQFFGRFRTSADRKEYIEFQDGSMFPLLDYRGVQSDVSESIEPRDSRFLRIEGQLMIGQDGKGFIVLKDGRRFPLQGSYTYTQERTYSFGGPAGSTGQSSKSSHHATRTWQEGFSNTGNARQDYEKIYGKEYVDRTVEEADPNLVSSRFRRESDTMTVSEFRKFEEREKRHRRETIDGNDSTMDGAKPQDVPLCKAAKCVQLRCIVGPLKKDQDITIAARYLVNLRTMKKVAFGEDVKVSSQLMAVVTKQPYIGRPVDKVIKSHETVTLIKPVSVAPYVVPLWAVVLSACAGTIILLLLIFLLHKCGFFKRNRPSDAPERQPLNRNGHFQQGDEHL